MQGLDVGIHTMRVGGIRRIIIPPALGYTDKGIYGPIPPNPFDRKALENLIDNNKEKYDINQAKYLYRRAMELELDFFNAYSDF